MLVVSNKWFSPFKTQKSSYTIFKKIIRSDYKDVRTWGLSWGKWKGYKLPQFCVVSFGRGLLRNIAVSHGHPHRNKESGCPLF